MRFEPRMAYSALPRKGSVTTAKIQASMAAGSPRRRSTETTTNSATR